MALNSTTWATTIRSALQGAGYFDDLTDAEKNVVENGWKILLGAHVTHITGNAVTLTTGVTGTGSPGGPLPIVSQPGVIT